MSNIQPLHGDTCPPEVMTPANVGHLDRVRKVWITPTNMQEKMDKFMDMLSEQHECITMFREDQVMYRAMVITVLGAGMVVVVRLVDFGNHE